MGSGGARSRSGPAPDPHALRRDRKDDAAWVTLPAEGFAGDVPEWPLSVGELASFEAEYWAELWRKPQAVMWAKLDMARQVAAYVRAFAEAAEPKASAGLKTAVLRMEAELGLSLPGMHSLRWRFSEDELAAKRDEPVEAGPSSARDRLRAIGGGS
jgi:hypothetical protein